MQVRDTETQVNASNSASYKIDIVLVIVIQKRSKKIYHSRRSYMCKYEVNEIKGKHPRRRPRVKV